MNNLRQTVINTMTGWGMVVLRALLAFYMVPFLLRQMGLSGYGVAGLLCVLTGLAEAFDLGLRQALERELAEQTARNNRPAFNQFASTGLLFYILTGLLLSAGCLLFAPAFISFVRVPEDLRCAAVQSVRIYGSVSFMLSFISTVFAAALTGANRFDLRNNIESFGKVITSLALILVLNATTHTLQGWVAVMLAGQALGLFLLCVAARRVFPWMELCVRHVRITRARLLVQFGWKIYILQLTNLLAGRVDPLIISRFFGPAGVALYSSGSGLADILRSVVMTLSNQMYPLATRQHVENALEKQQRMLIDGTRYTLLPGVLFSVALFVFARPFCALWLGSTLGPDFLVAARVLQLWAVADLMLCAASMQWPMLFSVKRINALIWIHGSAAVLNISLSIYFTGFTSLGVPGVVAGTIISGLILRPALVLCGTRVFKVPVIRFFREALARPLILAGLLIPAAYAIRYVVAPSSYFSLVICGLLTGLIWLLLTVSMACTERERQWVGSRVKKTIRFIS
jgi:O-antigen/teichoic acid export membrane protein